MTALLAAGFACPASSQELPDTLAVAVLEDWPPHYRVDEDGDATGFGVDVTLAVTDRLGIPVRFVRFASFPEAMEGLRSGAVDVIPDFGITPQRRTEFAFTRPFDAFRLVLFVRDSDPLQDAQGTLADRTIGTVRSNAGVELVARRYPDARRVVLGSLREALFELLAAGVDAVAYPEEVLIALARSAGVADRVRSVPPPLAEVSRAMGVRASDTLLAAELDRGIEELVGTPEYEAIVLRWFGIEEEFWTVGRVLGLAGALLALVLAGMAVWRYRSVSALAEELSRTLEQRDAAREASRREEERFRTLVETAYEGIVMADARNRITFVNRRASELVGVDREEILGRSLFDFVDEGYHERVQEGVARRRQGVSESYEVLLRGSEGEAVWVLLSVAPIQGEDGLYVGSVAALADITAQVRGTEETLERERRFRAFVEKASELISTLDADGTMRYQSPPLTRMLGYDRQDLEGRSVFDFIHPEDQEEAEQGWNEVLDEPGGSVRVGPFRFRHADGSWRTMTATLTNLLEEPAVGAIVSNSQDVTEREELERQLRQSQKLEAVGKLAGGVAHDFNNLLTVIRSQTDLILLDLDDESELATELELVQSAADRAATLTSQLLAFSRDQILRPRVVSLCDTVRDTAGLLERVIGEDVRIVVDVPGGLPPVFLDPSQLEQTVLNLAINARDAMPRGGTLTLSTHEDEIDERAAARFEGLEPGTYVALTVTDTGTGMDDETRGRIFEPFFTTKGRGRGTGLGLSMTYGFVKQTGGTIHVESEPGAGTTFLLRFPAVEGEPEIAPAPGERDRASSPPRSSGTVLVVEDDDSVRRATTRILERAGFTVVAVEDAEKALEVLDDREGVALVFTDLVLPGMSGRALAEELSESRPGLRLLVASGYADDSPGHPGDLPSHIPFIQKPFTSRDLVNRVTTLLEGRGLG